MKEFDPWPVLCHCSPALDGAGVIHKTEENFSWWIAPLQFCGWNKGFFFQPMVVEFDFQEFAPEHSSKHTFMMVRFRSEERRLVRECHPDGRNEIFPVLSVYICVNRGKFPPQDHQNKVEWLNSRTGRSRGIAHELLYADQYAKNFNPQTFDARNPDSTFDVQMPIPPEDEELLCPSYEIEMLLHAKEQRFGVRLQTVDDFRAQQRNEILGEYFSLWLEKHAVDAITCENRTAKYLASGVRQNHDGMRTALNRAKARTGIAHLDKQGFHRHMITNSPLCQEYVKELIGTDLLRPFQTLHREACVASSKRSGSHVCNATYHGAANGCSACRCDITHHTLIIIER